MGRSRYCEEGLYAGGPAGYTDYPELQSSK